jgi:anti-anti-sigma factor
MHRGTVGDGVQCSLTDDTVPRIMARTTGTQPMPDTYATFDVLIAGKVATFALRDRRLVEPDHIQRLQNELLDAVRSIDTPGVVVNFEKVEFLSSGVLGAVISLGAAASDAGRQLALCCLSKDILKVFKMMRLDSRLTITKTLEGAREAVS